MQRVARQASEGRENGAQGRVGGQEARCTRCLGGERQRLRRVEKSVSECVRRREERDGVRAPAVWTWTRHLRDGVHELFELCRIGVWR